MDVKHLTLTVEEFIDFKDNPVQRDTESRAARAKRTHLKKYSPTHENVAIAQVKNQKKIYKLDGHTRAYLWKNEMLELPNELHATMYICKDLEEIIELYYQFDNAAAVETSRDLMTGAFRFHGIPIASVPFLRNTGINSAVNTVQNILLGHNRRSKAGLGLREFIGYFKDEFRWIFGEPWIIPYSKDMLQVRLTSAHVAAMFLTVMRDGNAALEFWRALQHNEGRKNSKGICGVQLAYDYTLNSRAENMFSSQEFLTRHQCVFLEAYELWRNNSFTKRPISSFYPKMNSDKTVWAKHAQGIVNLWGLDIEKYVLAARAAETERAREYRETKKEAAAGE